MAVVQRRHGQQKQQMLKLFPAALLQLPLLTLLRLGREGIDDLEGRVGWEADGEDRVVIRCWPEQKGKIVEKSMIGFEEWLEQAKGGCQRNDARWFRQGMREEKMLTELLH
jgi:hypothetical protein